MSKWVGAALVAFAVGCDSGEETTGDAWQRVHAELPGALLSVWGTSATDVWTVGADARNGAGPQVLHFDGEAWTRHDTGLTQGDLWWVFGFADGPIYMGGDGGVIVRRDGDTFTVMDTPSTGTIYGIWGASPDDLWAVGGESDASGGFAWRLVGDAWVPEASLPADVPTNAAIWKAFGTAANDVWLVGSNGVALHWDGTALSTGDTGVGSSLFTVYTKDGLYAAVGGLATGIIVEGDGTTWRNVTPEPPPMGLAGVSLGDDGLGLAVGMSGSVYVRDAGGWAPEDPGLLVRENLHGAWVDDDGGLWAVGGQTLTPPLTDGVMIHRGTPVPEGVH
ncbi:MAG: hypothetical protein JNK45_20920 [Myxococcales bacterium]|nr:hypothetical protein [Myxococcales bacterium]